MQITWWSTWTILRNYKRHLELRIQQVPRIQVNIKKNTHTHNKFLYTCDEYSNRCGDIAHCGFNLHSLMANNVEHLFTWIFAIYISLVKCLFNVFCPFSNCLFVCVGGNWVKGTMGSPRIMSYNGRWISNYCKIKALLNKCGLDLF